MRAVLLISSLVHDCRRWRWAWTGLVGPIAGLAMFLLGGCQDSPMTIPERAATSPPGLSGILALEAQGATCEPPMGWIPGPLETGRRHIHQTWVSPTGNTAYGVIAIRLPLPIGPDLALWGFLREMRNRYGEGRLLSKTNDPALPGVRFVADAGPYRVRINLILRGFSGWAVYAGTRRDRPEDPDELELAERARENTRTGFIEQAAR